MRSPLCYTDLTIEGGVKFPTGGNAPLCDKSESVS